MAKTISKRNKKVFLVAGLGLLFPIFLIVVGFMAAKSDVERKREYEEIRQQQAEKFELQKQQEQIQQIES